ncbi:MAG: tetratricopeptide repeat protein [Alphaproteobacteria bacterium]
MRVIVSALMTIAGLIFAAQPAPAAETVFGHGDAQLCFEGARFGGGGKGADACDRALESATLTKTDRAATHVNRGIIYNRTGRHDDAVIDFNAALEIDPALGEAYLNRGNSRFFQKRMEEARADYSRAIELKSRDLHAAYFNRGLVHEVLGDPAAARADFEMALRVKPDFPAARARLDEPGE